tara:strand:- start:179 stop:475 length:297 start_codon:yes stop_codon:yes gene_type:complete
MAEEKQPVDANNEQSNVAPTPEQLGVADLKLAASIIEVVSNRGAIKAGEMAAVGALYNKLMNFLIANGAVEVPNNKETTEEESTTQETSAENKVEETK